MYPAVFVFVKPPPKGEVTRLSLRDIAPFRGDKSEHSVTVPFFRGNSVP